MVTKTKQDRSSMLAREKAELCALIALDHKAEDLILLKVTELSTITDYFVICTGKSSRHVLAIADHIEINLGKRGFKPLGIEGRQQGHWVLLDYDDVVVHVFYEPVRRFYDLESLWSDAEKILVRKDIPVENEQGNETSSEH